METKTKVESKMLKLNREFYARDTTLVAQELLGKYIIRRHQGTEYIGRVVEVEAYLGQHDLACHSSKGLTKRTQTMFGPAGYAYVYMIYGMYYCTNVVTESEGIGSAVLLRAIEPVQNIDKRTQGPGLLSNALFIDKSLNSHDLLSDDFFLAEKALPSPLLIEKKPRIGVAYAKEWADEQLRFYIKGNPFVSKK